MGKNLELESCVLRIREEQFTSCLIALRSSLIGNYNIRRQSFSKQGLKNIDVNKVEKAKDLVELLKVCNWESTVENGDIVLLNPLLKETSEERLMFKALSHFITDESRIVYNFDTSFTRVKKILIFKDKHLEIIKQPI